MNFNFELILFYSVVVTGVISLLDVIFFAKKRKIRRIEKMPILIDYSRSFFPVLLLVFLLRSFLYEPFRIPTGSLKPTLQVGDFILVNKFDYGIRLPVTHKRIYGSGRPHRGDIMVFRYPEDPSIDFIKRVIGVPGDRIDYINKILYVNGQPTLQRFVKNTTDITDEEMPVDVVEKQENFLGIKHDIYQIQDYPAVDIKAIVVPPDMYFVMGDNRDMSRDSRYWGFVPDDNIIGKADAIWMSWDSHEHTVRWKRIGNKIV
jgi:signal peptidase I